MMYRVIKRFLDLQDGSHHYEVGDPFPRSGNTVTQARLQELATTRNRQKTPLIEEVAEEEPVREPEQEQEPEPEQEEAPEEMPEEPKKKGRKK